MGGKTQFLKEGRGFGWSFEGGASKALKSEGIWRGGGVGGGQGGLEVRRPEEGAESGWQSSIHQNYEGETQRTLPVLHGVIVARRVCRLACLSAQAPGSRLQGP